MNAGLDLFAHRPHHCRTPIGGVRDVPVLIAFAREDGAGIPAPIVITTSEACTVSGVSSFGAPVVMSIPFFGHRFDRHRVTCAAGPDPAARTTIRPAARSLR